MEKDAKYRVVVAPVFTTRWYVGCDVKASPFTDKRVRQAIAYLIDRKRIVDTLLFYGVPTVLPWHETSPAYTPELANAYAYNPAKAKELLQQAGVTGEVSFPYTVSAAYVPTHGIAELVQGEMAKLGLKASIERLQHPDFLTKLNGAKFGGIWSSGVGFMHLEPSTLFVMSFPYRVPNSSGYDTPEYRQLIDQMLNTTDAAAKKQVYKKMNELLLDECFMIPINGVQTPVAMSAKIQDFATTRSGQLLLGETWKSK
jgi:peptide/nickel transport system substrate-binding protein